MFTDMSAEKDQHQDQALFFLGGLKAIAEVMQLEPGMHGCTDDQHCAMIKSCVQMALSNSTFEDEAAKALLCSVKPFMQAVVAQLQSPTDSPKEDKGPDDESESQKLGVNCEYVDAACCEEDKPEASHRQSSRTSSAQSTCCHDEVFCVTKMTPNHVSSPKYKLREVKNKLPLTVIEKKINVSQQEFSDITKKIQDITLDDAEYQEQPVNYSLKYSEEPGTSVGFSPISGFQSSEMSPLKSNVDDSNTSRCSPCLIKKEALCSSSCSGSPKLCLGSRGILNMSVPPERLIYDSYAETDLDSLDQPIDFSRKYHEYISEDCTDSVNFNGVSESCPLPDVSKDPPKLSCGDEDTVRVFCTEDTPLNFSSASSLTDLRDVGISGFQTPNSMADESLEKSTEHFILQKDEMFNNISVTDSQLLTTIVEDVEVIKGSAPAASDHEVVVSEEKVEKIDEESSVNVTPLMFSRSSSLGSLNSFDQPSSHDDQSSVSEFSHLASGVISPSDLPDSPLCYTPKVFEFENAPVTFSSCSSLSPLRSENGSIALSRNIKTDDCIASNCTSNSVLSESTPYMLMHSMNYPVTESGGNRKENLLESKLFSSNGKALPNISASLKMPVHRGEEVSPKLRENYITSHSVIKCIQQDESAPESVNKLPFPTIEGPLHESGSAVSVDCSSASHLKKPEILPEEKAIVEEFISLGMPKNRSRISTCSRSSKVSNCSEEIPPSQSSSQWSPPEHALKLLNKEKTLRQNLAANSICKSTDNFKHSCPSSVHASACLNPSEKAMIEECISLGMPKSRSEKRTDLLSKMRRTERQHLMPAQQSSVKHTAQCEQSLACEKASCSDMQNKPVARQSKNVNSERSTVLSSCKEIEDLPPDERALLEECISLGMRNHRR